MKFLLTFCILSQVFDGISGYECSRIHGSMHPRGLCRISMNAFNASFTNDQFVCQGEAWVICADHSTQIGPKIRRLAFGSEENPEATFSDDFICVHVSIWICMVGLATIPIMVLLYIYIRTQCQCLETRKPRLSLSEIDLELDQETIEIL